MATCLLPNKVEAFKKALKERKINIADLLKMTTEARTKMLEQYAGKNAADVNLLFERKLILKNKMLGIKNWASKVGEVGRYSPKKAAEIKALMEKYKKAQEERTFSPKEEEAFLNSLADTKLGVHISEATAKNIFDLTTKAENLKSKYNPETGKWTSPEAQADYVASKVIMERFIESIKTEDLTLKEMLLDRYYKGRKTYETNKAKAVTDLLRDTAQQIADISVSMVGTWDNSFIGRQGINTLMTHPSIWLKMAKKSFTDFALSIKKKHGNNMASDATMADVYGRENYLNGNYDKAKLIPKSEEMFPTTLPERVPVTGRVFKASNSAFTNSAIRARIDLFDKKYQMIKDSGGDITNADVLSDLAKQVNSLTARGDLGRLGQGGVIKLVMWAPKMLKGEWDVLTGHTFGAGLKTKIVRKQAFVNMAKIGITITMISAMAEAMGADVEKDPTSADFLAIRVGNTRYKWAGGKIGIAILVARMLMGETKNSTTKIKKDLTKGGYFDTTRWDVFLDFITNKANPFAKAIIDFGRSRTFEGEKPTAGVLAKQLTTPISIKNYLKTMDIDDPEIERVVGDFGDVFGISGGTYSIEEDWTLKDTNEMTQFLSEVGEEKFIEANKEFNKIIQKDIDAIVVREDYLALDDESKQKEIDKIKKNAKKQIFNKYNP